MRPSELLGTFESDEAARGNGGDSEHFVLERGYLAGVEHLRARREFQLCGGLVGVVFDSIDDLRGKYASGLSGKFDFELRGNFFLRRCGGCGHINSIHRVGGVSSGCGACGVSGARAGRAPPTAAADGLRSVYRDMEAMQDESADRSRDCGFRCAIRGVASVPLIPIASLQ